jgi:hypothetical protein
MVPIPEGVERSEGEPDDDDGITAPMDADGGVGGASFQICTGNRAGFGGPAVGVDVSGSVGGRGSGSKTGSGSKGKGKEREVDVEDSPRQSEIEREIVELTRRFERKQLARKMQNETNVNH